MKTTIYDFDFEIAGHGYYKVTYTSPATGKRWTTTTNNMPLIDATKNAEEPKRKDLEELKRICKDGKESRDAFVKVQTMIYQRMRETKK